MKTLNIPLEEYENLKKVKDNFDKLVIELNEAAEEYKQEIRKKEEARRKELVVYFGSKEYTMPSYIKVDKDQEEFVEKIVKETVEKTMLKIRESLSKL